MRVLFMGTPDFAVPSMRAILEGGHEIVLAVTQPDRPAGRGNSVRFSPVKEEALIHGIPVFQPEKVRDPEAAARLAAVEPDVAVVIAFGQILPEAILSIPRLGCLNVHASLLPAYRGAAPIQWAIINGETMTGVTIMQMDKGLDTGDILAVKEVPVADDETGGSLHDKLAVAGAELMKETLPLIEAGAIVPRKQGETTTMYAKMLKKETGCIDWHDDAARIERLIRGLSPWPSAYTRANGKTLKIWKAAVVPEEELPQTDPSAVPGDIILRKPDALYVLTGNGALSLLEVQMEGKKRMPIADFLRGVPQLVIEGQS